MHFRIFLPDANTPNPDRLKAVGLGHLIPGAMFIEMNVGDQRGMVVSWNELDPACDPTTYDWVPAIPVGTLAAGRYLVGFKQDSPPLPHELAWPRQFGGYRVTLGDGNGWNIPSAGELPKCLRMGGDGRPKREIRAEFRSYFEDSARWFVDLALRDLTALEQTLDIEVFAYLERAFRLNYRLTTEVVNRLELFATEILFHLLRLSVDGIQIAEDVKKNTPPAA